MGTAQAKCQPQVMQLIDRVRYKKTRGKGEQGVDEMVDEDEEVKQRDIRLPGRREMSEFCSWRFNRCCSCSSQLGRVSQGDPRRLILKSSFYLEERPLR